MKIMKILLVIACTVVFSMLIFANVSATHSDTVMDEDREVSYDEYERKYLLPLESDSDNKRDGIKAEADSSDDKLKEKYQKLIEKEKELDKKDIKAYDVLAKYKGNKYLRDSIITNKSEDIAVIREMMSLMHEGVKSDEQSVLISYISRRIDVLSDDKLKEDFSLLVLKYNEAQND